MDIKNTVSCIRKKHHSSNPFLIAKEKGILIIYEGLGSINGYYNKIYRQQQIHINNNLNANDKLITAAHELGHAIMHPSASTPFLKNNTYFSIDKLEIEANLFAMHLLISDEELIEYQEYTIEQLSRLFGYHEELMKLRVGDLIYDL